jgi:hypothetical protein
VARWYIVKNAFDMLEIYSATFNYMGSMTQGEFELSELREHIVYDITHVYDTKLPDWMSRRAVVDSRIFLLEPKEA